MAGKQGIAVNPERRRQRMDNLAFLPKPNYRIVTHVGVTPFMDAEIDFADRTPAGHTASFNSCAYTSSLIAPLPNPGYTDRRGSGAKDE
jgi:hypothetical protein